MSKISLEPNASGAGTFTLAAPNSNTNRTLNLPDEAGVVLTDTSDIEPQVKTATNAGGSAPIYACRAWVNFDGIGTVSIRASGNVSSVTRTSTAIYTINFTTAMPDVNYSALAVPGNFSGTAGNRCCSTNLFSTTSIRVTVSQASSGNPFENDTVSLSIFR